VQQRRKGRGGGSRYLGGKILNMWLLVMQKDDTVCLEPACRHCFHQKLAAVDMKAFVRTLFQAQYTQTITLRDEALATLVLHPQKPP